MVYPHGFSKVGAVLVGFVLGVALSVGAYFIVSGVQSTPSEDTIVGTWLFDTVDSNDTVEDRAMMSLALQGARLDMKSDGTGKLSYLGATVATSWSRNDEGSYHIELTETPVSAQGEPTVDLVAKAMVASIDEYGDLLVHNDGEADDAVSVFHKTNPDRVVPNALFTTYEEFANSVLAEEIAARAAEKKIGSSNTSTSSSANEASDNESK